MKSTISRSFAIYKENYRILQMKSWVIIQKIVESLSNLRSAYFLSTQFGSMDFKTHKWVTVDGQLEGVSAIIRKNVSLKNVDSSRFPYVVVVSLFYESMTRRGLPSDDDELAQLNDNERSIANQFFDERGALFGLNVTCDGVRDLFFFLEELPEEVEVDGLVRDAEPEFDYEFMIEKDPKWTPYKNLVRE